MEELEHAGLSLPSKDELLTLADRLLDELGWWWMEVTWFAPARRSDMGPDERLACASRQRHAAETAVRAMNRLHGVMARRVLTVGQSYAAHTDNAVFH